MKKIIALFIAFASFSCTQTQKSAFSSVALNEKLLANAFKSKQDNNLFEIMLFIIWLSYNEI